MVQLHEDSPQQDCPHWISLDLGLVAECFRVISRQIQIRQHLRELPERPLVTHDEKMLALDDEPVRSSAAKRRGHRRLRIHPKLALRKRNDRFFPPPCWNKHSADENVWKPGHDVMISELIRLPQPESLPTLVRGMNESFQVAFGAGFRLLEN